MPDTIQPAQPVPATPSAQPIPDMLSMMPKGKVVVITGPVGAGATTITLELTKRLPGTARLVTATTRLPKQGEQNEVDYHFFSELEFKKFIDNGNIVEYSYVPNRNVYYGTYLPTLQKMMKEHPIVFANVDVTGGRFFNEHYGALTIFIFPESGDELRERIKKGNPNMTEGEFEERLREAAATVEGGADDFDHIVPNPHGQLDTTVDKIIAILKKEGYLQ